MRSTDFFLFLSLHNAGFQRTDSVYTRSTMKQRMYRNLSFLSITEILLDLLLITLLGRGNITKNKNKNADSERVRTKQQVHDDLTAYLTTHNNLIHSHR